MKLEPIFLVISNIQNQLMGEKGLSEYDIKELRESLIHVKATAEDVERDINKEMEQIRSHNQSLKDEVENWKSIADEYLESQEYEIKELKEEHETLKNKFDELYKVKNDQEDLIIQQASFMLRREKEFKESWD